MIKFSELNWKKENIFLLSDTHGQLETNNKSFDVGIDNLFKLFGSYSPIRLNKLQIILNEKPILLDNRPQNRN